MLLSCVWDRHIRLRGAETLALPSLLSTPAGMPRGIPAGVERSDGSASVSAPRSLMCRSHTHDNNMIQIVPFLFHRPGAESSGTESQVGARLRGSPSGADQ